MNNDLSLEQALGIALQYHGAGKLDDALKLYQTILQNHPKHPISMHFMGLALYKKGMRNMGREYITQAIEVFPGYTEAWNSLGQIAQAEEEFVKSKKYYTKALELNPRYIEALYNLGTLHQGLEELDQAQECYEKIIAIKPDYANAHYNLGALFQNKNDDKAIEFYLTAIKLEPNYAWAHANLVAILRRRGQLETALYHAKEALKYEPEMPEAHSHCGNLLRNIGQIDEAIPYLQRAIALSPDCGAFHSHLAVTLLACNRNEEALASFIKAVELEPMNAEIIGNLGSCYSRLACPDLSVKCYRRALEINPQYNECYSDLLVGLPVLDSFSPQDVFLEHKKFGETYKRQPIGDFRNTKDKKRKIKIGIVSPSLSGHILHGHILPVFTNLDRENFELYVYAHLPTEDDISRKLKSLANHWLYIQYFDDEMVARRIYEDQIDILIHPMGHWANNRILVFAYRPAPIQVSYLAQSPTTGMDCFDYTISDKYFNWQGWQQEYSVEKVWELPFYMTTSYPDKIPPIGDVPSLKNGYITFASFNNPCKISPSCAKLWQKLLNAVPNSRLWLHGTGLNHPTGRASILSKFQDFDHDRIKITGAYSQEFRNYYDLLSAYNQVDIGLDTFPFSGGRTTEDALLMGVPVVTLVGKPLHQRISYSFLNVIGHPELCAFSEEEYLEKSLALVNSPQQLVHYRQCLHDDLNNSLAHDGLAHTRHLEQALRQMWEKWCD